VLESFGPVFKDNIAATAASSDIVAEPLPCSELHEDFFGTELDGATGDSTVLAH
jgi:hypothetical protein